MSWNYFLCNILVFCLVLCSLFTFFVLRSIWFYDVVVDSVGCGLNEKFGVIQRNEKGNS